MSNNKKYDFSFNLSSLATYTDELGGELVRRAILEGETAKIIRVQPGVKGSQAINLLNSNLEVQTGACGWNPSGTKIFTQRDITVCDYKVNEAFGELKSAQISQYIENIIWGASSATTCFSGFKELFAQQGTGTTTVTGGIVVTGQTALTSTTALDQVDNLVVQIPDDIADRDDLVLFMSHANYRKYLINFRTANYFHLPVGDSYAEMKTFHPATNILVHPVGGLNGSNLLVLAPAQYLVLGVDLMSDSEALRMFYSVDFDEVRLRCNFKAGVQCAWPNFVITNGLS